MAKRIERAKKKPARRLKTRKATRLNRSASAKKRQPSTQEAIRRGSRKHVTQIRKAAVSRVSSGKKLTVIRGPKQVDSSWVDSIAFVRYGTRNGVAVKFLDGAEVFYPHTDIRDYEYLRDAASKGKSIHRRFYDLPYEMLS